MKNPRRMLKKFIKLGSYIYENFNKILPIIFIGIYLIFISGFTYVIVEPPIWMIPAGNRIMFIAPYLDFQTIIETVAVFILMLFSLLGLILIQMSSKITYDRRYASLLLTLGIILFLITFLTLEYFLAMKMGWL